MDFVANFCGGMPFLITTSSHNSLALSLIHPLQVLNGNGPQNIDDHHIDPHRVHQNKAVPYYLLLITHQRFNLL